MAVFVSGKGKAVTDVLRGAPREVVVVHLEVLKSIKMREDQITEGKGCTRSAKKAGERDKGGYKLGAGGAGVVEGFEVIRGSDLILSHAHILQQSTRKLIDLKIGRCSRLA